MIDETTRRLPEWSEHSVWITLADGNQYAFPKPWLEIRGHFSAGKPTGLSARTTFGPELDEGVELIHQAESNHDLIIATLTLGAFLLRLQYDLSDEELQDLLAFRFADENLTEQSLDMVREIAAVAMGTGGSQDFRGGNG